LRTRGLVLQITLLCAAEALAYNLVWPRGTVPTPHDTRLSALLVYCTVLLVLVVRARRAGLHWRTLLGAAPEREELPLLAVVVPIGLLTMGAAIAVYIPLSYVAPRLVERAILSGSALFDARTLQEWMELALMGVVAAPVVEELFFRGFLLQRWARRWGTAPAVVASSALFAVLHGEWIGHFVFGVAMAALYLRTRRLWMPMAAHALNNGVVALFSLIDVLRHAPPDTTTLAELRGEWPVGIVTLAAGIVALWWYLRRYWPAGEWRAVLRGAVPYDRASYAASATGSPDTTSAS
jgi:membrane protease YdiL (CAAX protease family)